jgi:hypothetical protein
LDLANVILLPDLFAGSMLHSVQVTPSPASPDISPSGQKVSEVSAVNRLC